MFISTVIFSGGREPDFIVNTGIRGKNVVTQFFIEKHIVRNKWSAAFEGDGRINVWIKKLFVACVEAVLKPNFIWSLSMQKLIVTISVATLATIASVILFNLNWFEVDIVAGVLLKTFRCYAWKKFQRNS